MDPPSCQFFYSTTGVKNFEPWPNIIGKEGQNKTNLVIKLKRYWGLPTTQEIWLPPESGRPGGNTLIARMNRGSLAAAVAVYKGYSVDQPRKKNNDTRIPLHSRSARALRLFIRLDSNRHGGMAAATLTSFSMSNLLQEKGVYLRVHGGVSSAAPEQGRQQARFFRMVDYSYKSSPRKMRKWLFCSHSFWHCEKLWKHHTKYNGWSSPETIFSRSSVGGIQQFPAIREGYIIYYIVLYSPRWHSALLVSFPSDLSTCFSCKLYPYVHWFV